MHGLNDMRDMYQTVPLPDGRVVKGLFPTDAWYQEISKHISFDNMNVLDLGCSAMSYGLQALRDGARSYTGIESDLKRVRQCEMLLNEVPQWKDFIWIHPFRVEDFQLCDEKWDIAILSMLMHWLENPQEQVKRYWAHTNYMVFVYRYPNHGVLEPGFRPTVEELSDVISATPIANVVLSDTVEQNIRLVIYGPHLQP